MKMRGLGWVDDGRDWSGEWTEPVFVSEDSIVEI